MIETVNKKEYFICFVICLVYFSFVFYKTLQDGAFFNSPILTSILIFIGVFGMPQLMYQKIVLPFIKVKD
jgi:hypothetical protein